MSVCLPRIGQHAPNNLPEDKTILYHSALERVHLMLHAEIFSIGVVRRSTLQELLHTKQDTDSRQLAEIVQAHPVVAYPDEPLRVVVYRMAETGFTRLPVVARDDPGKLLGMISLHDLLQARVRNLEAEQRRERLLPVRLAFPRRASRR